LRKVYRVLPAALARDQPQAAAVAQACFEALPHWDLELLAELEPQGQVSPSPDLRSVLLPAVLKLPLAL
jgi:hypothetical protein